MGAGGSEAQRKRAGDEGMLKMLLDAGVDAEAQDRAGRTALICAAMEGHFACVEQLLARCARGV